jgi:hypothetical protein
MTSTPGAGLARFEPLAMDEHLGRLWADRRISTSGPPVRTSRTRPAPGL